MIAQILLPAFVFTAIVVVLSAVVLFARRRLAPSGEVLLSVNGQTTVSVPVGFRLLTGLAEAGIFLPAACGGRGTCGQCRIRVVTGGGPASAAERTHISDEDLQAGFRLACMTPARGPMQIQVPERVLAGERRMCQVSATRFIAPYLKEIVLTPERVEAQAFRAGDYVVVESPGGRRGPGDIAVDPEYRDRWTRDGVRSIPAADFEPAGRAYSLANAPGGDSLTLVVRLALPPPAAPAAPAGCVSTWLFGLDVGASVPVTGPFGDFHATDADGTMVLIGGGAGIAPLRSIALEQLSRGQPRPISFWYGARDRSEIGYALELAALAEERPLFDFHIALSGPAVDADWTGATGFIHQVVHDLYLRDHPAIGALEFYLCGPPLMSTAVLQMLGDLGVARDRIYFDDFGG